MILQPGLDAEFKGHVVAGGLSAQQEALRSTRKPYSYISFPVVLVQYEYNAWWHVEAHAYLRQFLEYLGNTWRSRCFDLKSH